MGVMTLQKRIPMSRDAYDNLPEGPPFYDYVDGEAIEVNRASVRHGDIVVCVAFPLRQHVRKNALGLVAVEVSLELPDGAIYGPDILFISSGSQECKVRPRADAVGTPDLVVEVLSPSTESYDRHEKLARYHRAGVKWIWLIVQDSLLVEEYRWSEEGYVWMLPGTDRVFRPELFPGLELDLVALIGDSASPE